MSNLVNVAFYHLVLGTGEPLVLAQLSIEPGWHVYWENPGQSGLPTEISGSCVTNTVFSPPHLFLMPGDVVNYGYEDSVSIFAEGQCNVGSEISINWLACQDDACVPGSASGTAEPLPEHFRQRAIEQWTRNTQTTPVQVSTDGWVVSLKIGINAKVEFFPSTSLESQNLEVSDDKGLWRQTWRLQGQNNFGNNDKVVVRIKKRGKEKVIIFTSQE